MLVVSRRVQGLMSPGTDGPCDVGAVYGPRSSVAVAVCWRAGSEACVKTLRPAGSQALVGPREVRQGRGMWQMRFDAVQGLKEWW